LFEGLSTPGTMEPGPTGLIGVLDPTTDGALCDVTEVAAVEIRVIEGAPEDVVDDVSRL
jgi:hypothetical protein